MGRLSEPHKTGSFFLSRLGGLSFIVPHASPAFSSPRNLIRSYPWWHANWTHWPCFHSIMKCLQTKRQPNQIRWPYNVDAKGRPKSGIYYLCFLLQQLPSRLFESYHSNLHSADSIDAGKSLGILNTQNLVIDASGLDTILYSPSRTSSFWHSHDASWKKRLIQKKQSPPIQPSAHDLHLLEAAPSVSVHVSSPILPFAPSSWPHSTHGQLSALLGN
jgi:hypothetical protein